jgi:hypothetical protein
MTTMTNEEIGAAVAALIHQLATEVDLHYEDDDFFALAPQMSALEEGSRVLEHFKLSEPDVLAHVRRRYQRARQ